MSKKRSRVLVVDDEEEILRAVGRALVINGYDVETAADGTTAIHSLTARAPDVVVLDVSMPGVDGLEVCRRLRKAGDRTPVLVLTARDGVDDRVAGLDAGADDYLVKPFALEELLARLRAHCSGVPARPRRAKSCAMATSPSISDRGRSVGRVER
jgi:two-component system response regulator MprA